MSTINTRLSRRDVEKPLGAIDLIDNALISFRANAKPENRFAGGGSMPNFKPVAVEKITAAQVRNRIEQEMANALGWGRAQSGNVIMTPKRIALVDRMAKAAATAATTEVCRRLGGNAVGWESLNNATADLYAQRGEV